MENNASRVTVTLFQKNSKVTIKETGTKREVYFSIPKTFELSH